MVPYDSPAAPPAAAVASIAESRVAAARQFGHRSAPADTLRVADRVRFARPLTHTATVVTVAGALLPVETLSPQRYTIVLAIGATYLGLGTWWITWVERQAQRRYFITYFAAMSSLCVGLVVTSQANATIAAMPLLSQAVLFGRVWHATLGGVALLGIVTLSLEPMLDPQRLIATLLSMAGAIAFVIIFSLVYRREVFWRARSDVLTEQLAQTNEQLERHAEQIEELAASRERNRVAREVHDGLGHYLTAIHVQLEAAKAVLPKSTAAALEAIDKAQNSSRQGLLDVRQSVTLLRSATGTPRPFVQMLQDLTASIATHRLAPEFIAVGTPKPLSAEVEHELRRVLQETLSNVQRHAHADRVLVRLEFREDRVVLEVQDDGRGPGDVAQTGTRAQAKPTQTCAPSSKRPQFGLVGMRERVQRLNGVVDTGASALGGFRVTVEVPV